MDLVRSWLISAAVLLGVDFVINLVVGQHLSAPYLLGPFLAGVASTLYHAERGVGGWGRHVLAVLPVPAALQVYSALMQEGVPTGGAEGTAFFLGLGVTTLFVVLGFGVVMMTRLLLMTRTAAPADSELS